MTPSAIEPTTFRFVAQHLNHCATAVPKFYGTLSLRGLVGPSAGLDGGGVWEEKSLLPSRIEARVILVAMTTELSQ